ncbi:hypothetical protein FACS1894120_3370 [Clostridia bacterium]|nr:hypothetical protein FACS1894120_3370 [Clostridia bacterium]
MGHMSRARGGTVGVLITLGLFTVFTLFLLLVLMTGSTAFRSVSSAMDERFKQRTALFYVTQKIRRAESGSQVSLGTIANKDSGSIGGEIAGGAPVTAVILREDFDGEVYLTYIYESGGYLKELFVAESEVSQTENLADSGFDVLETDSVSFEMPMSNLLRITCGGESMFVTIPQVSGSAVLHDTALDVPENSENSEISEISEIAEPDEPWEGVA